VHTAPIVVVIMAKMPQAGTVKTRLCPPLSPVEATALYESFLRDKIAQIRALRGVTPALAYTPLESRAFFEALAPDFVLLPQQGADLTARLLHTFQHLFTVGYTGVIATDSDSPTLPVACLEQAVAHCASPQTELVLGPSDDGGYYLIGLRQLHRTLFEDMPWSTSVVYVETLRRAAAQGLRVASLPAWFDVDTATDLARLRNDIAQMGAGAPQHTQQFFASHVIRL